MIYILLSDSKDGEPIEDAILPTALKDIKNIQFAEELNADDKILLKERVYGYSNINSRQQIGILPEEIEAVKYLYERFMVLSNRKSLKSVYKALVKEMKNKGFPPPPNGWTKKSIEKNLKDPIYIGSVSSDRVSLEN